MPETRPSSATRLHDRPLGPVHDPDAPGPGTEALSPGAQPGGAPLAVEREFTTQTRSQWGQVLRRFAQHRLAMVSLVLFVLIVLFAFLGQPLWKYQYDQLFAGPSSKGPTAAHPFGTDNLGHDLLAQVIRGTQRSLEIALFVALVSTTIGTIYGLIAGFFGGTVDNVLMRLVDLVLTIPIIAVAAVLGYKFAGSAVGNGWLGLAVVIALLAWAPIARVVRGVVLSLREREYIEAARALGASNGRILFRHLLPNVIGPVIVNATIYVSIAILLETALSYLGFGVKAPETSLGLLIQQNQTAIDTRPWLFYFPALFIVLVALSINFVGDGMRDALDPQQKRVRA